ncbi:MAG: hypothetical protein HDS17_00830 [Bacteroides sp.]|nr:hypothetical protein [Bacteroides sp.]
MMFDSHTHILRRNAIVDIDPADSPPAACGTLLRKGYTYSVGIHPWNVYRFTPDNLRLLRALAAEPSVIAIGECGLDPNLPEKYVAVEGGNLFAGAARLSRHEILTAQTELLKMHYGLSETLGKPLILHIVKSFPEIIALKRLWKPAQPWIVHGFRGKPQLARELLNHGFYLSFGQRYNPLSLALTPPSRLLRETDEM